LRGGERQRVHVDRLHAATEFQSERYLRLDDKRLELWDELSGTYRCGDGRWLRIHTMFAHHRERIVDILGCASERDALVRAFEGWSAAEFEERAVEAGAIAAMMRSQAQWHEHPQHEALDSLPVVTIERIGGASPASACWTSLASSPVPWPVGLWRHMAPMCLALLPHTCLACTH